MCVHNTDTKWWQTVPWCMKVSWTDSQYMLAVQHTTELYCTHTNERNSSYIIWSSMCLYLGSWVIAFLLTLFLFMAWVFPSFLTLLTLACEIKLSTWKIMYSRSHRVEDYKLFQIRIQNISFKYSLINSVQSICKNLLLICLIICDFALCIMFCFSLSIRIVQIVCTAKNCRMS